MPRMPTEQRLAELRGMPYADYLQTPEWRRRRDRALARALWSCEWPECRSKQRLEVHHKTYEHLGDELDQELGVLCEAHHRELHACFDVDTSPDLRRYVRIARAVLDAHDFHDIGAFIEAVKQEITTQGFSANPQSRQPGSRENQPTIDEAITRVARYLRLTPGRPEPPAAVQLDEGNPCIDQREARQILMQVGAVKIRRVPTPARVTPRTADTQKALDLVLRELEETQRRCEALERECEGEGESR